MEFFGGSPEEMFERMKHMMNGHKHKVVKTIEPTTEEGNEWMALQGFYEAAKKAVGQYDSRQKLFWAKVELRTGEVTRNLHWNDEKGVIEIRVCDHGAPESGSEWES